MTPAMCPDVSRFNHFWTNLALVPHDPVTRFHGPVQGRGPVLLTRSLVAVLQDIRPQIIVFRVYEALCFRFVQVLLQATTGITETRHLSPPKEEEH